VADRAPAGRLNVGVLGLGLAGADIVRSLADDPFVDIVAIADPRPNARERFQRRYGGRAYDTVDGLCADPSVAAVWVATPTQLHLDHATALASSGKHLVVDKPLAASLDEAERLAEIADKNHVVLVAGGVRSFDPAFSAMRELVETNVLGPVVSVQSWVYTGWMARPRQPYELDESLGGGCLLNQAPHVVDVSRLLGGGRATRVRGATFTAGGRQGPGGPGGAGGFSGWLDFAGGVTATFTYNGYGLMPGWELVPWGETPQRVRRQESALALGRSLAEGQLDERAARLRGLFGEEAAADPAGVEGDWVPGDAGVVVVTCRDGMIRQSAHGLYVYGADGRRERRWADPASARAAEARELVDAIRSGTPPLHDGRWGVATSEAVFGLLASAASGQAIELSRQVAASTGITEG
jgi:phthalate 4,5-cis-dihydrodiol dehydrogenase